MVMKPTPSPSTGHTFQASTLTCRPSLTRDRLPLKDEASLGDCNSWQNPHRSTHRSPGPRPQDHISRGVYRHAWEEVLAPLQPAVSWAESSLPEASSDRSGQMPTLWRIRHVTQASRFSSSVQQPHMPSVVNRLNDPASSEVSKSSDAYQRVKYCEPLTKPPPHLPTNISPGNLLNKPRTHQKQTVGLLYTQG